MGKTFYGTVVANDELVEIPLDRFLSFMIGDFAQFSIQRMAVVSVDFDF